VKRHIVCLSKNDWSQLLDLASVCIDREVVKYGRMQDELADWRKKCLNLNHFVHLQTKIPSISIHCGMN